MIELRRLQAFVAVAEAGHITRAAERLGMAQPPLSRLVHGLEKELGTLLLRRLPRGVEPTTAGIALLEEARSVLAHAARIDDTVRRTARGELGRLARRPWTCQRHRRSPGFCRPGGGGIHPLSPPGRPGPVRRDRHRLPRRRFHAQCGAGSAAPALDAEPRRCRPRHLSGSRLDAKDSHGRRLVPPAARCPQPIRAAAPRLAPCRPEPHGGPFPRDRPPPRGGARVNGQREGGYICTPYWVQIATISGGVSPPAACLPPRSGLSSKAGEPYRPSISPARLRAAAISVGAITLVSASHAFTADARMVSSADRDATS